MDTAGAGGSTVRIAVNDISASPLLFTSDSHLLIPLRAVRSLSRLDTVLRAERHAHDASGTEPVLAAVYHLAYKCPSFPRLDRYSSLDELRLAVDADSMSPRLSNATLSQDLDGELLAMSIGNLYVPSERTATSRHDATLTRSASARTVTVAATPTTTFSNLLSPPNFIAASATATPTSRRLLRSTSCPSITSSQLVLSPSPSSLLQVSPCTSGRRNDKTLPVQETTTAKPGKGRAQLDGDVDLHSERVNDLPLIATSDFPDFIYDESKMAPSLQSPALTGSLHSVTHHLTLEEVSRFTSQRFGAYGDLLTTHLSSSYRHRAPQLVQIKCLQWLSSLDQGAA